MQGGHLERVVDGDHLVKKEVEMNFGHLSNHWQELAEPDLNLLAYRGIEDPISLIIEEFRESRWIAVFLAVNILRAMLLDGVEDIHRKTHLGEMIVLDVHYMSQ